MRVSTTEFEFSHGRKPRGRGYWMFQNRAGGVVEYGPVTYTEAVRALRQYAREISNYGEWEVLP